MLAAMGTAQGQLEFHMRAALNSGVSREEIVEIVLQVSVYAGVHDGTVIDLEPENAAAWMPTAPHYKRERAEPTGATPTANPQAGEIQPLEDGLLLEIEDPDPWAQDNEPIFWAD